MASDTDTSFDIYVATSPGIRGRRAPRRAALARAGLRAVRGAEPHARAAAERPRSCNPPVAVSSQATMGSPDALGGAANFVGFGPLSAVVAESRAS